MKRNVLHLLLVSTLPLSYTSAQELPSDSMALVDLYMSTDGDNWTNHSGWLTATPVEQWHGIKVEGGRVTEINLSSNGLSDTLPESLGDLNALRALSLSSNMLQGQLPERLGEMTALEVIEVSNNALTGTLPATMENLTHLELLYASGNQFSGGFPEVLLTLDSLIRLELGSNNFSGPLPAALENMTQLELLSLDRNAFSGPMISLANFTSLVESHFDYNQLTGDLSEFMAYLPSMYYLSMSGNNLTGCLNENYFNLDELVFLYFSDCDLDCLGDFSGGSLQRMHVNGNALTFDDLEPNASVGIFLYQPQDSLLTRLDTMLEVGSAFVLLAGSGGAFTQYQWYRNGELLTGATNDTLVIDNFDAAKEGTYYCIMTNTLLPDLELVRRPVSLALEMPSNAHETAGSSWQVYPNPVKDILRITIPGYDGRITLTDYLGRIVHTAHLRDETQVDVSTWPMGSYYLQAHDGYYVTVIQVTR